MFSDIKVSFTVTSTMLLELEMARLVLIPVSSRMSVFEGNDLVEWLQPVRVTWGGGATEEGQQYLPELEILK